MSFLRFLKGIGDKLGVLEVVSQSDNTPAVRIQTRSISLRELASEIRAGEVRTLADSPVELAIPFDKIFEAAGIAPESGAWTIERLKEVLTQETFRQKNRAEVQSAVLQMLNSENVPVENIVKDAIARDRALDSFEARAGEKIRLRKEDCRRRLADLERQISELQGEHSRLEASLKADEDRWHEWRSRKRVYEKEMAAAAGYIIDHEVITTEENGDN